MRGPRPRSPAWMPGRTTESEFGHWQGWLFARAAACKDEGESCRVGPCGARIPVAPSLKGRLLYVPQQGGKFPRHVPMTPDTLRIAWMAGPGKLHRSVSQEPSGWCGPRMSYTPLLWFLPIPIPIRGGGARQFSSEWLFHRGIHPESTWRWWWHKTAINQYLVAPLTWLGGFLFGIHRNPPRGIQAGPSQIQEPPITCPFLVVTRSPT
jgi:hypothetical protein